MCVCGYVLEDRRTKMIVNGDPISILSYVDINALSQICTYSH